MKPKNRRLLSLENLLGSVEWRREVSPIRAAILAHMDKAHQVAFLRPTHCQLWKDQRDIDPAVAAAELVEKMDTLRAEAHAAFAKFADLAVSKGFHDDEAGAIISFRRNSDDASMYVDKELCDALPACEAAQNEYWQFIRGRSASLIHGYRVGAL